MHTDSRTSITTNDDSGIYKTLDCIRYSEKAAM